MAVKNKEMETRIIRSRIQLLVKYPFFGTLALSLEMVEDESISTAGVDGKRFFYNPEFIKTLDEGELNWVVAHEVMHCALGHIWRRGARLHEKFNIACDYAIHSILKEVETPDFKMPKNCLYDPKFHEKSAEEIYSILPDMPSMKIPQGGSGNGSGNSKDSDQGQGQQTLDDHSKWDSQEVQQDGQIKQKEWMEKMVTAAEVSAAKQQGNMPGMLKRIIGDIKKPQKNWRQLLAEFVQFEVFDYGFNPPDKRFTYDDILLPDFNEETEKLQDIVFVIDTSGSIGSRELSVFFSELVGMMQQFSGSVKGHIIFADADVAAVYDFEDVDDILKARPAGGGGTDFRPAFEYCNEKIDNTEWDVVGLVYLTDGFGSFPDEKDASRFGTLWLSTTENMKYPFGQTAFLDITKG